MGELTPFERCCEMKFNMQYDNIFEFKLPLLQKYRTFTNLLDAVKYSGDEKIF